MNDSRVMGIPANVGVAVEEAYPWELPKPAVAADLPRFDLRFEVESGTVTVAVDDGLDVLAVSTERTGGEQ